MLDAREGIETVVKRIQNVTGGIGAAATINLSEAKCAAGLACSMTAKHSHMIQIAQVRIFFFCLYCQSPTMLKLALQ